MTRLDIVLPVFRPLTGWEEIVLQRYASLCGALGDLDIRLIVVNDGTPGLVETPGWKRLAQAIPEAILTGYPENRGKGFALRHGVRQATADLVVYTDIDWPYTEASMVRVIGQLQAGAEAVIGVRDESYYRYMPATRRIISRLLRRFNGMLLRLKVNDTQAGLKGFRRVVAPVFLETTIDRYLFDLEFVYRLSHRRGIRIEACPVELRDGITFSVMNRKILLQEARNFLRIWMNAR